MTYICKICDKELIIDINISQEFSSYYLKCKEDHYSLFYNITILNEIYHYKNNYISVIYEDGVPDYYNFYLEGYLQPIKIDCRNLKFDSKNIDIVLDKIKKLNLFL